MRGLLRSGVTDLRADRLLEAALTDEELNDLIAYCGWNVWDMLGKRATEGESGLIRGRSTRPSPASSSTRPTRRSSS